MNAPDTYTWTTVFRDEHCEIEYNPESLDIKKVMVNGFDFVGYMSPTEELYLQEDLVEHARGLVKEALAELGDPDINLVARKKNQRRISDLEWN